ncbi:MAG: biotin--[acetyl-CoA-carboxylase] ligase [Proteobacteria bacterium]|nr:biotin--[acetyl-CoA-carboxylase] ligase [Pseudomonadota bacterium]
MINLDGEAIRRSLGDIVASRLSRFDAFDEIESTNSYLMQQAGPPPGRFHVAITDNQTRGRGRHGRVWRSPPGSGLCASVAYTFDTQLRGLPALTLAIGLGLAEALDGAGVPGVRLKWPNDLVAGDGKLGGILTETQARPNAAVTVVAGVGINVDLGPEFRVGADRALCAADLAGFATAMPPRDELAARLIDGVCAACVGFEDGGFARYADGWSRRDWLRGRELTIETTRGPVTGIGAGIDVDGALLVDEGGGSVRHVTSGSVVAAGATGPRA